MQQWMQQYQDDVWTPTVCQSPSIRTLLVGMTGHDLGKGVEAMFAPGVTYPTKTGPGGGRAMCGFLLTPYVRGSDWFDGP